jgi:universal stress protein A
MAMTYQHILFATDFSDDAPQVGERAKDIARKCGARLSMIHVIEDVNVMLGGGYELLPVLPDLPDEALLRESRNALGDLARRLELEVAETWVVNAPSTKEGILDMAHKQAVDLIVIGSHGRHGLALLLGSTANAVLHGAPCDVLAVRIRD